jgi:hypothetical protein
MRSVSLASNVDADAASGAWTTPRGAWCSQTSCNCAPGGPDRRLSIRTATSARGRGGLERACNQWAADARSLCGAATDFRYRLGAEHRDNDRRRRVDGRHRKREDGAVHAQTYQSCSSVLSWSGNGLIPGPTFRLNVGDTLTVRLVNRLNGPTGIHWHGAELANRSDGTSYTQNQVCCASAALGRWAVARCSTSSRRFAGHLLVPPAPPRLHQPNVPGSLRDDHRQRPKRSIAD